MPPEQAIDYLVWAPSGASRVYRLAYPVVTKINVDVMRGFGVTRRRGTEAGGLLLGRTASGRVPEVTVDEYEAVPVEYAFGPSFVLSPNDRRSFTEALNRHKRSVVGFWRSHTREGLELDDNDRALLKEFFPQPNAIAVLIKPFATRANLASVFTRQGERWTASSSTPFPFGRHSVGEEEREKAPLPVEPEIPAPVLSRPAPSAETAPAVREAFPPSELITRTEPAPQKQTPAPPLLVQSPPAPASIPVSDADTIPGRRESPAPTTWKTTAAFLSFTFAAILLGGIGGYQIAGGAIPLPVMGKSAAAEPAASVQTGLNTQVQNNSLLITWDHQSALVRSADKAVLDITEGTSHRVVDLTKEELRNGSVLYHNASGEVQLRIEWSLPAAAKLVETRTWRAPSP